MESKELQDDLQQGRRGFLRKTGALTAGSLLAGAPFGQFFPGGLIPVALAQQAPAVDLAQFGKTAELQILGDRPVVAETPAHLLDDDITPLDRMFIRNNGLLPDPMPSADTWAIQFDGESVKAPVTLTLADIRQRFKARTLHLSLECGGNGRAGFNPPARGNQWTTGGVGFPEWTGVRVADILEHVGLKDDAVYLAYYGADIHLSKDPSKVTISRGVPIAKAMEPESLLVWAMNGKELAPVHGYPVRLMFSGYPGSTSGKWVKRIAIRNKVHDGEKMGGHDYRVACEPLQPGEKSDNYCVLERMPVKSLITFPRSGIQHEQAKALVVRGQAWTGSDAVKAMDVSFDFGQSWQRCDLRRARNRYAPQRWETEIRFPKRGYYEIWARATDSTGLMQPMVTAGWNVGGYGNNACHRIAVRVV